MSSVSFIEAYAGCDFGGGNRFRLSTFGVSRLVFKCSDSWLGWTLILEPACLASNPRIGHIQRDAYTLATVDTLRAHGPFAVAIDDGSHFLNHQQFFVEHYAHLLSEIGIGCVERRARPVAHIAILYAKLPEGFMGYTLDLRLSDRRYDSLLFFFCRKGTP